MEGTDLELHCGVCGTDLALTDCPPLTLELVMDKWAKDHDHTVGEVKMYLDAEVAVRQYEIDTFSSERRDGV